MQITMRRVDDIGTIDQIFTPHEDTGFRNYIKDRYERTMDYLEKTGTSASRAFLDRSRSIFDSINNSDVLRKTRATIRSALGMRDNNRLFYAYELDRIRTVGPRMQRFLMADPVIRTAYHRQRIDGYSDTYKDNDPKDIGKDHYDYRRVTNGVYMEEKDENGEDIFVRTVYYEELHEGDRELDGEEQLDILHTWDIQRKMFEAGMDTTCRLGGEVG